MSKTLLVLMLTFSLLLSPVSALDLSGVSVSVESSWEKKGLDNLNLISIDVPLLPIDGGLIQEIANLKLQKNLVNIGYEVSKHFNPYVLIGGTNLKFDKKLNGYINFFGFSGSTTLLNTEFNETLFTWGLGASGLIAELPAEVMLSYDVRGTFMKGSSSGQTDLIPDLISGISIPSKLEVDYREISISLIASREIELWTDKEERIIKSVEPFVGYRYTRLSMNLDNTYQPFVVIKSEQNYVGDLHSAIVGAKVNVNDNLAIAVNGLIGDEKGVVVRALFSF